MYISILISNVLIYALAKKYISPSLGITGIFSGLAIAASQNIYRAWAPILCQDSLSTNAKCTLLTYCSSGTTFLCGMVLLVVLLKWISRTW